ncbi:hypothetical protein B0H13DRAFT_2104842 [Mycena leptocephala]|nr:hypothetical protein B0H13DRAFT_2104842 [Mycena leptocephala]
MDRHLSVYRHFSTQLLLFRPTVSPSHPTVRRMQHCTFLVPTLPRPALLLYNPPRPHSTSYSTHVLHLPRAFYLESTSSPRHLSHPFFALAARSGFLPPRPPPPYLTCDPSLVRTASQDIIAIYSNPTLPSHGTVFSLTLVLLIVLHLIDRMKQCWVLKWCGAAARRVDGGLDGRKRISLAFLSACETAKGDRCRRCPASCGSSAVCTILRGCCLAGFRDVLPEIPSRSVAGARNLIRIIFPSRDGMARFIRFRRFSGNGTFLKSQGHFYLHTTPVLPALIASYWRRLMPSDQLVGNRTGVCLGVQSWIHSLPRISRLGYY